MGDTSLHWRVALFSECLECLSFSALYYVVTAGR